MKIGDKVKFTTGTVGVFLEFTPKRAKFSVTDLLGNTKIVIKKLNQVEKVLDESSEQSDTNSEQT